MESFSNRLVTLLTAWYSNTATVQDKNELRELLNSGSVTDEQLTDIMRKQWDTNNYTVSHFSETESNNLLQKILQECAIKKSAPVIRMTNWKKWIAAAAVLLILSLSSYFFFLNNTGKQNDIVKNDISADIAAPATSKATIKLADGRIITLDSLQPGTLANQGNVKLIKNAKGEIIYDGKDEAASYNTLTNPRGSKVITLTLSDGTQVWLNAESSLKYPISFIGKERKVEITGEGFFAVVHNEKMPFKVIANGMEVHDIGTEFNVNAYDINTFLKTTLIKGLVKVINGADNKLLTPGQQAQVTVNVSGVAVNKNIDLEEVLAWKNGRFHFSNADIKELMLEIGRWYDVDVNFISKPNMRFGGKIDRNSSLMQVLKILEESGVRFKLEGKTITVL